MLIVKLSKRRYSYGYASLFLAMLFLYLSYDSFIQSDYKPAGIMFGLTAVFLFSFYKQVFLDSALNVVEIDNNGISSKNCGFITWDNIFHVYYHKPARINHYVPTLLLFLIKPVSKCGVLGKVFGLKRQFISVKLPDTDHKPAEIYNYIMSELKAYREIHGRPGRTGDKKLDALLDESDRMKKNFDELSHKLEKAMENDNPEEVQSILKEYRKKNN